MELFHAGRNSPLDFGLSSTGIWRGNIGELVFVALGCVEIWVFVLVPVCFNLKSVSWGEMVLRVWGIWNLGLLFVLYFLFLVITCWHSFQIHNLITGHF